MNERATHRHVLIEAVAPDQLADVASLAAVIWRAHYPSVICLAQIEYMLAQMYDLEVMRRELQGGISYDRLLVNGELRGFAAYGPTLTQGELKLHKLYIHPDVQRQGLGALMLQHVEDVACQRGVSAILLAVNKRNTKAIAAYRKHGFTIRKSVVTDIGGGFVMDDYIMVKLVTPPAR